MYNWLSNYLFDRKQFTVVNQTRSEIGNVICGVPQGSVLGPLLFLIYMNDITFSIPGDKLRLFADDTNLFLSSNSIVTLELEANRCLKKLEIWFIANKLSLNATKTCYTLFSTKKKSILNTSLNLNINGQAIIESPVCKYLGVYIDKHLSWDSHVNYVYKKLIKYTGIFYKLRDIVPRHCLNKLYYAFVHPHILYGIEIYGNSSKTCISKLYKLNNKLIRILLNKKLTTPSKDLYSAFNTLPITVLHEMQLLLFVHKCVYDCRTLPEIFDKYFDHKPNHSYDTKKNNNLYLLRPNSVTGQKCSQFHAVQFWNSLPFDLKSVTSKFSFKKQLKLYLFDRTFVRQD